ncbi:PHP domain-containing protein [Anaerotalea alkaliphila]|uniref:PHP domain-containing protein n=1 Tax=Anaerotalea alkaliphila TaxID=2662126 RepID=A0A7X5HW20_9FIRM|nr:PHP domain-containing protein [Anaerotalea alkaliphila]NDL67648.1 PHP domain-containing protein [Anaerotalea alkaliphila]
MTLCYDFHIHTALSPCGHEDMTPNNIVNMALINGLDAIAVTDHNSCGNVGAVMEVARDTGLVVIPGMEVETREEIHVVCLFETLEDALRMQEVVYTQLPDRKNSPKLFGTQLLMDQEDEVVGEVDRLLSFATGLSLEEVVELADRNHGVAIPAHIDRPSYSVISNLGMIPPNPLIRTLEVSQYADRASYKEEYPAYRILQSSDSHDLGYIGICRQTIKVKDKSISSILDVLK